MLILSLTNEVSIFASNVSDPKAQASTALNAPFHTFFMFLALYDVSDSGYPLYGHLRQ